MIYKNLCAVCFFFLCAASAAYAQEAVLPVIPAPVEMRLQKGYFIIDSKTVLNSDISIKSANLVFFNQYLKGLSGFTLRQGKKLKQNVIRLSLDPAVVPQQEGYQLHIDQQEVRIRGHDAAGVFYGLQTLVQLLKKGEDGRVQLPACMVNDYPRFGYRGMHLDVGRHLFPVNALKKWIDLLALYKVNTFHWHLTDDQGWRIEIKKYPALQKVSSMRAQTIIGHKRTSPHQFDGKAYGGYYSQQEVKDIVSYATERHITVIPEIEMPGHAQAALAAYPELGCTGGPYHTATYWGVFEDVYCAGKEETFTFLENVLDEVLTLFPSPYIHIGGDECPKTRWKVCPACQQRMHSVQLKDEHELQSYFIRRMEKYLEGKGRKIIGWDEILEGGLAPSATVMSWRGLEGGIAAAKMHHEVIMTPEKYVYLDYYQSRYDGEQIAAGGYTPLIKVYNYEPVPAELNAEEAKYIKGVQANAWSEYLSSTDKAEYMLFPRMFALSEIAWTKPERRNYPDFLKRLRGQEAMLDTLKLNRFRDFDEITAEKSMQDGQPVIALQSSMEEGVIRYTTDGTLPSANSPVYRHPIVISASGTVQAVLSGKGAKPGRIFRQDFTVGAATGKKLRLLKNPSGSLVPEHPDALLNGISGSPFYNDGEWSGFSGDDLEAVIDLENQVLVSSVGMNILKYHWQKIWEPWLIRFEVSADGIQYKEVYRQTEFTAEGINQIRSAITPQKARYIRVTAVNKGTIPAGEYGAGGKALLVADEIFVN